MKSELLITLHEDNKITAVIDDGGEFHEEHYPEMSPIELQTLIDKLINETNLWPSFVKVVTGRVELKYDTKFLKVWEDNGYSYSERLGKDSVTFILYNKDNLPNPYALIKEYKPPIRSFLATAFGGSIDKKITPKQIVLEKTQEEAGYKVQLSDIYSFGKVMVSTQSNQMCHLFLVDVQNAEQCTPIPESLTEVLATVEWMSYEELLNLQDWKAPAIGAKFQKFGYNYLS